MVADKKREKRHLSNGFARVVEPVEVALFMPAAEDSSNRVANVLAELLCRETFSVNLRLFLTAQRLDPRIDARPSLREKSLLHAGLLRDVVFPFQRKIGLENLPEKVLLAPDLLSQRFPGRVFITEVADFNDPTFIQDEIIGNKALKMAVSVRNLRKFDQPIIDAFNNHKGEATLANIHPAMLPGLRGLEGPFWTRFKDLGEYTTTLHVVDLDYDTGPILDYYSRAVNGDAKKPVMCFVRDAAPEVARMIYEQVHLRLVRLGHHRGLTFQSAKDAGYYTLPTQDEIDQAKTRGIVLTDAREQMRWLASNYARGKVGKDLRIALETAYRDFTQQKIEPKVRDTEQAPFFLNSVTNIREWPATGLDKPVILIPRLGEERPDFLQLKVALEAAGFEAFSADVSKLESLSNLKNLEGLKHAFERPGALPLDPNLATYVQLLSLIDRDVVVSFSALPEDMDQAARGIINRLLLKVETAQAQKNEELDNSVKSVFTRIPVGQDIGLNPTPEAIQEFIKNAQAALAQAKAERHAAPVQTGQTETPEAFKKALG